MLIIKTENYSFLNILLISQQRTDYSERLAAAWYWLKDSFCLRFDLIEPQIATKAWRFPLMCHNSRFLKSTSRRMIPASSQNRRQPSAFRARLQSPTAAQIMCKADKRLHLVSNIWKTTEVHDVRYLSEHQIRVKIRHLYYIYCL